MEGLQKLRRKRGGIRAYITKTVGVVESKLLNIAVADKDELHEYGDLLKEKLKRLNELDEEILEEACDLDDELHQEIEDAAEFTIKIKIIIRKLEREATGKSKEESSSNRGKNTMRARLPKLQAIRFSGKPQEWTEFYDSFTSTIDSNMELSPVDKFNYLKSLVDEPAKSCIAGFPLTAANYEAAKNLLKSRYGKEDVVQRAYLKDLLGIQSVTSEKNVTKLRQMHDQVEVNHRGLQSLGVCQETYSKIVVQSLLEKLPDQTRITMMRGKTNCMSWSLDEFLEALLEEVELRENSRSLQAEDNRDHKERRSGPSTASALATTSRKLKYPIMNKEQCPYCLGRHEAATCRRVESPEERKCILRKFDRCFLCLGKAHRLINCRSSVLCKNCGGSHHVSLCFGVRPRVDNNDSKRIGHNHSPRHQGLVDSSASVSHPNPVDVATTPSLHVKSGNRVVLQTALASINGIKCRVLSDSGSHRSFVTKEVAQAAGLEVVRREKIKLCTFGQVKAVEKFRDVVTVRLKSLVTGEVVTIEAIVVPIITEVKNEHLERVKKEYAHLKDLWFTDANQSDEMLMVHVLIGADYLWTFLKDEVKRGEPGEPVALNTTLGFVLSGQIKGSSKQHSMCSNVVSTDNDDIDVKVNNLWDLDSVGIRPQDSVYEAALDDISFDGVRYSVGLPWKEGVQCLPSNWDICFKLFKSQLSRLQREPDLLDAYDGIIREQLRLGIVEQVHDPSQAKQAHYLPWHSVIRKEALTTKIRLVYNASCKQGKRGVSLNDCLHVGPSLTPLLLEILIRFRERRVALVGDIEKAFLNISVNEQDRDFLRFFWFKNVKQGDFTPIILRFSRVVFGVNSSPFLLNSTLRYHLDTFKEMDPDFVRTVANSFYVDDLVTGQSTEEEAKLLYSKCMENLAKGGFKLRKWQSNSKEVMDFISNQYDSKTESDVVSYAKEVLGSDSQVNVGVTKVLGIGWDSLRDKLVFNLEQAFSKHIVEVPTKRHLLSSLASLFNPTGILSPLLVPLKSIFQEMCINKLGWDDPLTPAQQREWNLWMEDVKKTGVIEIPRCFYINKEVCGCELHGFSDASNKAYCAMVFLRYKTEDGWHTSLITAKTRIAPLKELTIPRLELMGARILAQLMDNVRKALEPQLTISKCHYWVDSMTTLYWIQNKGEWKQFVRHRVNEILKLSDKTSWQFCPGDLNPADIGSRGALASVLKLSKLWWEGPLFLQLEEDSWPSSKIIHETKEGLDEVKVTALTTVTLGVTQSIENVIEVDRFSRVNRLFRVTAWVLRFMFNAKCKQTGQQVTTGALQAGEIKEAESKWIKAVQQTVVADKGYKQWSKNLGLYEDQGLIRCKGRIEMSDMEYDTKFPILIPRDHRFTELVVSQCHEHVHHSGVSSTLAKLRTKFWVPKGRQFVKKVLAKCVVCKRVEGKPFNSPPPAPLPEFRVRPSPAFDKCGVDFCGPLFVKEGNETSKVYVALFSCCVTRALYLDIVTDLSTSTFLRCLRKFIARMGVPSLIVSDNAKTFKGTSRFLSDLQRDTRFLSFCSNSRLDWKFNLERAPFWGGFFERMVGLVKRCLRKVLGKAKLTYDELLTVLQEVESSLNARPLVYLGDEPEGEVLTPFHLMYGRKISSLPRLVEVTESDSDLGKRFKYLCSMKEHFLNKWAKEYLVNLRENHSLQKGVSKNRVVAVGDVVLVHGENTRRSEWKVGIVERLILGKDQEIRGASVRIVSNGKRLVMNRPVQKLYPLEISLDK